MYLKDYYGILGIEPSATQAEIKKAYRRLAHLHHPDKTSNDAYAAALFADIKEAYEILTDPAKKEYYLQQRWYEQSIGKRKKQDTITPAGVLLQALELEKHVSQLDVFRMDKTGLQQYILALISDEVTEKLQAFGDADTNREIIRAVSGAMKPLPLDTLLPVSNQLRKLAAGDTTAMGGIDMMVSRFTQQHRRERYSLLVIIILTLALCLLIYFASRP